MKRAVPATETIYNSYSRTPMARTSGPAFPHSKDRSVTLVGCVLSRVIEKDKRRSLRTTVGERPRYTARRY